MEIAANGLVAVRRPSWPTKIESVQLECESARPRADWLALEPQTLYKRRFSSKNSRFFRLAMAMLVEGAFKSTFLLSNEEKSLPGNVGLAWLALVPLALPCRRHCRCRCRCRCRCVSHRRQWQSGLFAPFSAACSARIGSRELPSWPFIVYSQSSAVARRLNIALPPSRAELSH